MVYPYTCNIGQCFTTNYERQKLGLELIIIIVSLMLLILQKWGEELIFAKHVPFLCQALCWLFYYRPHFRHEEVEAKRNWLAAQARSLKRGLGGWGDPLSLSLPWVWVQAHWSFWNNFLFCVKDLSLRSAIITSLWCNKLKIKTLCSGPFPCWAMCLTHQLSGYF